MTETTIPSPMEVPHPWLADFGEPELRAHALQTRSRIPREHLAREITGGWHSYQSLIEALESGEMRALIRPHRACLLAQIIAAQRLDADDPIHALAIFEQVISTYGHSTLSDDEKLIYTELMDRAGRPHDVNRAIQTFELDTLYPGDAAALRANSAHASSEAGSEVWLSALNDLFAVDDLDPVTLAPGDAPVLDRLESTSAAASVNGPLVTVIVPTWRPGPWLWTAVRSLTQQTYADLQILVMDDLSGPEYEGQLDALLSMDSRIEIITSPKNRGTYASRNAAVRESARGEFVTIQDDDDWSHPQRIERQIEFSRERRLAVGMCRAARVTEDLQFVRRAATFIRRGYPTTLVSRGTFTKVGFWDPVRRNSDFEFIRRVRRSKQPTGDLGAAPMMLQRHRGDSLSSGEVWEGYTEQSRRWQNWLSSDWHTRSVASGQRLYMGSGRGLPRPYPAPHGLTRASRDEPALEVDTLVVADFGKDGTSQQRAVELLEASLSRHERIGILHVEGFRPLSETVDTTVADLARRSGVTLVTWNDDVSAATAHVLDADYLALCDSVTSRIRADHVDLCGLSEVADIASRLFQTSNITAHDVWRGEDTP